MQLDNDVAMLEKTLQFINDFKLTGFEKVHLPQPERWQKNWTWVQTKFKIYIAAEGNRCRWQRRRLFSFEAEDESVQDPSDSS